VRQGFTESFEYLNDTVTEQANTPTAFSKGFTGPIDDGGIFGPLVAGVFSELRLGCIELSYAGTQARKFIVTLDIDSNSVYK